MPISKPEKGKRQVYVYFQGKQHQRTYNGTDVKGARALEQQLREELEEENKPNQDGLKFSVICEKYSEWAVEHLKESTWFKVRIYQVATLIEHFGKIRAHEFEVEHIDRFKSTRIKTVVRKKKVSAVAVNNDLRVFSAICTWARKRGHPVPKDLKWEKLPERGKGRARAWTNDELRKLYQAAYEVSPTLFRMLVFLINTGCRKGECMECKWSWIDFHEGIIRIPLTKTWQAKNGLPREVPLSDALREVLEGEREHPTVVFPNRNGVQYESFPKELFWEALKQASITGHPHMTRHTYASHFLASVPDLFLLAQVLGHSSIRITELYSHMLPGRLNRAKNAVSIGLDFLEKTLDQTLDQKVA